MRKNTYGPVVVGIEGVRRNLYLIELEEKLEELLHMKGTEHVLRLLNTHEEMPDVRKRQEPHPSRH